MRFQALKRNCVPVACRGHGFLKQGHWVSPMVENTAALVSFADVLNRRSIDSPIMVVIVGPIGISILRLPPHVDLVENRAGDPGIALT